MSTGKRSNLWQKFARSKAYREEFVAAQVRRDIPFQIRAMIKMRGVSQEELAATSGVDQSTISRAIDPEYGKLNLATIIKIAAGFDVAFIGRFVPFSELDNWFSKLSEESVQAAAFDAENEQIQQSNAGETMDHAVSTPVPQLRGGRFSQLSSEVIGSLPRKPANQAGSNLRVMPSRPQQAAGETTHYRQKIGGR